MVLVLWCVFYDENITGATPTHTHTHDLSVENLMLWLQVFTFSLTIILIINIIQLLYCDTGENHRERIIRPGVPYHWSAGDLVLWPAVCRFQGLYCLAQV